MADLNPNRLRNTTNHLGEDEIPLSPEQVRCELERITATDPFRRSERATRLLQTLVEYTLSGRAGELKEYTIAIEVFGRKPSFDPHLDPIVRVEVGRLRKRLQAYYENEGRESPILIALPLRQYAAVLRPRPASAPPAPEPLPPSLLPGRRKRTWMLMLFPIVIVFAAGIFWYHLGATALSLQSASPAAIAVLPFTDLSAAASQDPIAEGLSEEIIDALSHVSGVRIISRLASSYFKGKSESVPEIGRRLGVKYILEGSIHRTGKHLRIIARLVETSNSYTVWSKSFDSDPQDRVSIEQQMAHRIVDNVRQYFGLTFQHPFTERASANPDAYRAFTKAVSFSHRWSEADLRKSVQFFEEAVAADSEFAAAWAGLADACLLLAELDAVPSRQAIEKARSASRRAISLDRTLGYAHASLGYIQAVYDWNWHNAEGEFVLAHDLDPGDARIHEAWVTGFLVPMGRFDEALKQILEAQQLDPVSARIATDVGATYFYRREFDLAIQELKAALELDPSFLPATLVLADAYSAKGMATEAARALDQWKLGTKRPVPGRAGQQSLLPWAEQAVRQRLSVAVLLNVHPGFDSIRSTARFRALMRKVNLPEQVPSR
jgi:TolB-like protein